MTFEFDPAKSVSNQNKHGLSLTDAQSLWSTPGVEVDLGSVGGEDRYARLALVGEVVFIAIFTLRGEALRLISARHASKKEARFYEQHRKK